MARSSSAASFPTSGSCQSKRSGSDCQPPVLLTLTPACDVARARTAFSSPALVTGSRNCFRRNSCVPNITDRSASSFTNIAGPSQKAADTIRQRSSRKQVPPETTADEVNALTAYLLFVNQVIPEDQV